ncbi:Vesicle-associated protein [Trichinella pseudospiralis]|uniref:MSP domain-containing protein n=2 Tax=Trichinella pseudospiralis TaxID=6337 RepID=A0A0V0XLY8_TRIPS|nr:hypothetical protein T4E_7680 [Trichinella pseudospiralis]KRY86407.1 hypothetical protein T4D_11427 [Trichinella pseudospiralis]
MDDAVVETFPEKEIVIIGQPTQTAQADLIIKNISKNCIAYKIRCSSFKISISPKIGILEQNQSCKITLTRQPVQDITSAKLLIMTVKVDNSQANPTFVWGTFEKLPNRKRLKIKFQNE